MAKLTGAAIMARALKDQGVEYMFGIVGFPVQPIAREVQKSRHQVLLRLSKRTGPHHTPPAPWATSPGGAGAALTVSGPGVVHGLAGVCRTRRKTAGR